MRPFLSQNSPQRTTLSPPRNPLSLQVDDIPGARPKPISITKNTQHYFNRLYNGSPSRDYSEQSQIKVNHDIIFGSGSRYYPSEIPVKIGKKLYNHIRWASEIGETNAIKSKEEGRREVQLFDYPRSLMINDIPGAVAGSKKSKALKNHVLAERMRKDNSVPRLRPDGNAGINQQREQDSLDQFYKQHSKTQANQEAQTSRNLEQPRQHQPSQGNEIPERNYSVTNRKPPSGVHFEGERSIQNLRASDSWKNNGERRSSQNQLPTLNSSRSIFDQSFQVNPVNFSQQSFQEEIAGKPSRLTCLLDKRSTSVQREPREIKSDNGNVRNTLTSRGYQNNFVKTQDQRPIYKVQEYRPQPQPQVQPQVQAQEQRPQPQPQVQEQRQSHQVQEQRSSQFHEQRPQHVQEQRQQSQQHERQQLPREKDFIPVPKAMTSTDANEGLYKKIYTFNVISNQPNLKMVPANSKMPYKYAIPFNAAEGPNERKSTERDTKSKNDYSRRDYGDGEQTNGKQQYVFGIPLRKSFPSLEQPLRIDQSRR